MLESLDQTVSTGQKVIEDIAGGSDNAVVGAFNTTLGVVKGATGWMQSMAKKLDGKGLSMSNINDQMYLLAPYKYLYAIDPTHKKFVFPYLTNDTFTNLSSNWNVEKDSSSFVFNEAITDILNKGATAAARTGADLRNLSKIIANVTHDGKQENFSAAEQTIMEMAKSFVYSPEGPSITVTFTLFNTVVKKGNRSIWKDHYKFIWLFMIRNMAWKLSASSFLPPLLYDVVIPGQKRLPLAYVSKVDVKSIGIQRLLKTKNFMIGADPNGKDNNQEITVNVPEAWQVTISFKSLIGDNANLMASGIKELPITVS